MTEVSSRQSFLATRRGKLTLLLLCAIAFLDFVDASIVNIALPDIRHDLNFSIQDLQWVLSGYLLTYGGFMLLGGRLGDLLGRRRILVTGTAVFAIVVAGRRIRRQRRGARRRPSRAGPRRGDDAAGRAVAAHHELQGRQGAQHRTRRMGRGRRSRLRRWRLPWRPIDRRTRLALGAVRQSRRSRAVLLVAIFVLIPGERRRAALANFDIPGSLLVTGGMLLLVYALVKAPDQGWASARTLGELIGAGLLLAAFVANEQRSRNPLIPLSIFRVRGLAAADVTLLVGAAGLISMFFFLTLYMQNVLGFSPLKTGAAYLPFTAGVAVSAGISSQLLLKIGTRPLIVVGNLISAGGLFWLSHIPADGTYFGDMFGGMMIISVGLGAMFVAVTTAANAGVSADKAGLAAAHERLTTGRRRTRARDLLGHRHRPHHAPVRVARSTGTSPHLGIPPGSARRVLLRTRHRTHRAAHEQQPRRPAVRRRRRAWGRKGRARARTGGALVTSQRSRCRQLRCHDYAGRARRLARDRHRWLRGAVACSAMADSTSVG